MKMFIAIVGTVDHDERIVGAYQTFGKAKADLLKSFPHAREMNMIDVDKPTVYCASVGVASGPGWIAIEEHEVQ